MAQHNREPYVWERSGAACSAAQCSTSPEVRPHPVTRCCLCARKQQRWRGRDDDARGRALIVLGAAAAAVAGGSGPFLERDRWFDSLGDVWRRRRWVIRSRDGRAFLNRGRACPRR